MPPAGGDPRGAACPRASADVAGQLLAKGHRTTGRNTPRSKEHIPLNSSTTESHSRRWTWRLERRDRPAAEDRRRRRRRGSTGARRSSRSWTISPSRPSTARSSPLPPQASTGFLIPTRAGRGPGGGGGAHTVLVSCLCCSAGDQARWLRAGRHRLHVPQRCRRRGDRRRCAD